MEDVPPAENAPPAGLADALDSLLGIAQYPPREPEPSASPPQDPTLSEAALGANLRLPTATQRLRYHLHALRSSRYQPYLAVRHACAYLLLCGVVAALGWLVAALVG